MLSETFRWAIFNLVTHSKTTGLYFSGRLYVAARMCQAHDRAVKEWEAMPAMERELASRNAWEKFRGER